MATHQRLIGGRHYPWVVVALLWFCGFFNYADRQAVNAVFPKLQKEFNLSDTQLGWVGSSFMIVYALSGPLSGFVVDRVSRRHLVALGLGFWSLIAAGTGLARSFGQLLFFRAAEGLGESFYFPASMSLMSDYHGPKTRSRAMSIHQTSVYAGIIGGSIFAGVLADRYSWRIPFFLLGGVGAVYAFYLYFVLIEPMRGKVDQSEARRNDPDFSEWKKPRFRDVLNGLLDNPAALALIAAFLCANFVTMALLTWLPLYVGRMFDLGGFRNNFTATVYIQTSSFVGVLIGGYLADKASQRLRGGRMIVQGLGLLWAAPFVYWIGTARTESSLAWALIGVGIGKGTYESSIFASLYDVIPAEIRGTAAGLMNTVAWLGGSLAPVMIGYTSKSLGLSVAIGSTSAVYVVGGAIAILASRLVRVSGKVTALDEAVDLQLSKPEIAALDPPWSKPADEELPKY